MSAALSAFYRRTILIAEARLRKQATHDPLTDLANRSHFHAQPPRRWSAACATAERLRAAVAHGAVCRQACGAQPGAADGRRCQRRNGGYRGERVYDLRDAGSAVQPLRRAASYRPCTLGTFSSSSRMRAGPDGWVDKNASPPCLLPLALPIFCHRLTAADGW